jgi:hypothetical protein
MVNLAQAVKGAIQSLIQLVDTAPGESYPYTLILTAAAANVPQPLQMGRMKRGIVRNLSSTDVIQIFNVRQPGSGTFKGIPLNPAVSAGQGGDSIAFGNIDSTDLYWQAPTAGDQIAVYWEA